MIENTEINQKSISIINSENSDEIVVAFGGVNQQMGMPVFEFFNILKKKTYTKVFIRDKKQSWYHLGLEGTKDINETAVKINEMLIKLGSDNKRVIFIGNSAGGYAAIVFGVLLKVNKIIAFSPQTFLGRFKRFFYKDRRWKNQISKLHNVNRNSKYYLDLVKFIKYHSFEEIDIHVYFGVNSKIDKKHFINIMSLPFTFHLYPYGEHSLIKELKKRKILQQILNDL